MEFKRKINLKGFTIIPGIIDAHCHLISYSTEMEPIDLTGVRGVDEMIERIQIYKNSTQMLHLFMVEAGIKIYFQICRCPIINY